MPALLELYLSIYIFPIILGIFLLGTVLVLVGFRKNKIKRRKDVIIRASLMHGTYIFFSHGIGVIGYSLMYIMMLINGTQLSSMVHLLIILVALLTANITYYITANYLWSRLSIGKVKAFDLTRLFVVFVTPWYFFINI